MIKLREYIRQVLLETYIGGGSGSEYIIDPVMKFMDAASKEDPSGEELLVEPDYPDENNDSTEVEKEASGAAAVAGVTVPLGAGPTYPKKPKKKRKSATEVAGKAFGNAKPIKK